MRARFSDRRSQRPHSKASRSASGSSYGSDNGAAVPRLQARVIAAHGRLLRVRTAAGDESLARPPGRDAQVVCGDRVECEHDARHAELRIVAVAPRSGALYRSNLRGEGELMAANLTLLAIVVAPLPTPDFFIVDRYLAAAECAGIRAAVLLNKAELALDQDIETALATYARLGLAVLRISALADIGLHALRALLRDQTAVLVGQSGVGKSSLSRLLVPDSSASVGALLRDDEGRHTTSAIRLYQLPEGGAIIDSPGVRDFAPAIDRLQPGALGFPEIAALSVGCRFADCRHLREPVCAVRAAVGTTLDARRYESYRRLRRLYERLQPPPGSRPQR